MLKKNKFWGAIGCLILCSSLFACPSDLNIKSVLAQGDLALLENVSEKLINCTEWQDSLAMVYHKLSILNYLENDFEKAILFTEKALLIRIEIYKNNPHVNLGKSYSNLGVFYKKVGEFLLAKYNFQQSITVFEELEIRNRLRNSQYELSSIYEIEGDFQKSETLLKFLINSALPDENILQGEYLVLLANTYRGEHKYELAKKASEEAIGILSEGAITKSEAQAHLNIGLVYYKLEQYDKATKHHKNALKIYQLFKADEEIARTFNNLGLAFLKNGDLINAKISFEQGLLEAQSINQIRFIAQSYDNLGELYFSNKEFEKSSKSLDQALHVLLPALLTKIDLNKELKKSIQQSPFKIDLLVYLSDKTRVLKGLFKQENNKKYLVEALRYFEIGDYLIDQLRQSHSDQSTKLFWREEVLPFYEKAIEITALLDDVDKAFLYFEKSKSILLLEALLASDALQSIPDNRRREIKYLERQIRLKRTFLDEKEQKKDARLLEEILNFERNLAALNESLLKQYPQLKEHSRDNKVIDLNSFSQVYLKNKDRALVHYFYGQEHVYALVLNHGVKQIVNLGENDKITKLVREYLQYFEQAIRIESEPKAYLKQAEIVYNTLVKPLKLQASTHLLIIPSGILTYLPFEALVTAEQQETSIAEASYLLDKHSVCYGFSATFFDQLQQREANQFTKSLLGYAPFADRSTPNYPRLNFSQDELSKVGSLIDIDLYPNEKATLVYFLNHQSEYAVLHLSTHAFSSFYEEQPHIVFADSSFYLADLYQQYIPANLVVLSACQTQIGKLAPGEGVLGLSRGFFYAGARSVVSSLWNLNAQSSATILANFYEALNENIPKYLALQQAKSMYLNDENIPSYQKTPYYWAGMNYYGDNGQWVVEKRSDWWKYLLGGLVILVGIFLGFKK